jgi:hypothetical protein
MMAQPAEHWELEYERGETSRSWFEHEPVQSLRMIATVGISPQSIIDIGGGSSRLADALIRCGWSDITVLDVSEIALQTAQRRLGEAVEKVTWISHDLLTWVPARCYRVWHDRAVIHFFTEAAQREQYRRALTGATTVGSIAIVGCFAPDGPERCSGLPRRPVQPRRNSRAVRPQLATGRRGPRGAQDSQRSHPAFHLGGPAPSDVRTQKSHRPSAIWAAHV